MGLIAHLLPAHQRLLLVRPHVAGWTLLAGDLTWRLGQAKAGIWTDAT